MNNKSLPINLPINWCIKADHLEPKIAKYFNVGINAYAGYYHYSYDKSKSYHENKLSNFTEISYTEFEKWVLNIDKLPEKWAINSNSEKVVDWFNKQIGREYNPMDGFLHMPYFNADHGFKIYFSDGKNPEPGYTEISLDTFERKVLGLQPIAAKCCTIDIIDEDYDKKIIGYKAPYDLFNGDINKGDLFVKTPNVLNKYYYPSHIINNAYALPKEIVETWEHVYEPQETKLVLGSSKIEITIKKGQILADKNIISIVDIKALLKPHARALFKPYPNMNVLYKVELLDAKYKIGCSEFTLTELKQIVTEYNKYNNA